MKYGYIKVELRRKLTHDKRRIHIIGTKQDGFHTVDEKDICGWIPVTEKLPEVGSIVLCYCKNRAWMVGRINVCKYCAADKYKDKPYFDYNMNGFPEVIAWMPLPEPYEEGGENV